MLIVDSHLDISMNAIDWNRDLNLEVDEIRRREADMTQKGRGCNTLSLPEMHKAELFLSCATVIDRTVWPDSIRPGSATQEISYAKAQGQLACYRLWERQGKIRMISDWPSLEAHYQDWLKRGSEAPLGFILAMEGADPIVTPDQAASWYEDGLRIASIVHYGVSAYAYGTGLPGPLKPAGIELLKEMDRLGIILDLSHLAEEAFWQALDIYSGPVQASHNNCRALVPGDRQFSDDQLKAIVERDGVIGVACDAWMLYPGWVIGETMPEVVDMEAVANHIDHICQLAGNADHVGIGSDLDGGYGTEQTPSDMDKITDLQHVQQLLQRRGYSSDDIENVMYRNWLRFFQRSWS